MADNAISRFMRIPVSVRDARERQEKLAAANPHLMDALTNNKRQGQRLAVYARWVALAVIAMLLPIVNFDWSVIYYEVILLGFALIGWAQLKAGTVGLSRWELFLLFCDLALMTVTILVPNPFSEEQFPDAMQYRLGNFIYFFVLLAAATLAYSWRTIIAFGTWTFALWITGMLVVGFFGRQIPQLSQQIKAALPEFPMLAGFFDPNNILIGFRIQEIVVFVIVAAILALNGWRNNELLLKQAEATRERENLARHFPPNIVDQMADQDDPFGQVRSQSVAVLFADIVGFTHMAEQNTPERVVGLLRQFHGLLEAAVFNNNGTLDKFLGDGVMATFGTPRAGPDDAANAIRCAHEMLSAIETWNIQRVEQGEEAINLSIGIHFGAVVLGDIGSSRRLEFATLGDTVNVASRLEALTRSLDTRLIVSNELINAVDNYSDQEQKQFLSSFQSAGRQSIRGRSGEIEIWKLAGSLH